MLEEHSPTLTESELDQVLHSSETVFHDVDRACPFCGCSMADAHQLQNHIATHLQRVALFALPRSHDIQDVSEAGSLSSQVNALSQGSQHLSSEHDTDKNRSDVEHDVEPSDYTTGVETLPATKLTLQAIKSISTLEGSEDRLWRLDLLTRPDTDNMPPQTDIPVHPPEGVGSQKGAIEGIHDIGKQQADTVLDANQNADLEMRDNARRSVEEAQLLLQDCLA